ncbi:CvpA family protein [Schlesneria paludicola]|uniref:CvpA family protein n=1 Tax=Schlesneria paludicola TaxID=360056 RepID=UPI0002FA9A6C|nr:CvpA family protein [Schlesneria paludicola]
MIDIACLIVVGVVTWMVANEGIWGAVETFLCTLLAALIAMNFFEPLAVQLKAFLPDSYTDVVALVGLFIGVEFALRLGCENLAPSYIQVIPAVDSLGRWLVGAGTGYLTMAFLLTALHTAPLPREFMQFEPERNNFFGGAPDRQWLGFTQYVSERPLARSILYASANRDIKAAYMPHIFDGRYEVVGNPLKPYSAKDLSGRDSPQVIWPSFPIRYAMRRDRIARNLSPVAPPAPISIPPAQNAPGGGSPSNVNPGF